MTSLYKVKLAEYPKVTEGIKNKRFKQETGEGYLCTYTTGSKDRDLPRFDVCHCDPTLLRGCREGIGEEIK